MCKLIVQNIFFFITTTISGMMAAWEFWEKALIPSQLSGSGTWFGLKTNTKVFEICDSVQNFSGG